MFTRRIAMVIGIAIVAAISLSVTPAAAHRGSNTVWLCMPGAPNNPCEQDLTATVVNADGTTEIEPASVAQDPPIDCFYVYPTVSGQTTLNANLNIDPEEKAIAVAQAQRFSSVCKVYAPMYRQLTLSAINSAGSDLTALAAAQKLAYSDVLSAWRDYRAHYNHGRGVVLMGHSQGTGMLTTLITKEIDPNPSERRLLVSALMIGGNVLVPKNWDVGGSFRNIPACLSDTETGCVIAYNSFLEQPGADSNFGKPSAGPGATPGADYSNLETLCTNPASLSGGSGDLKFYNHTGTFPGVIGALLINTPASTPWVSYPGLYTAHCETVNGVTWLQVDVNNIPGDQRSIVTEYDGLGLHLYDYSLAMGNLIDIVQKQAQAYVK
jgi:hypothetical protein